MHGTAMRGAAWLALLLLFASTATGHQPEPEVLCVEGSGPLPVPERAHTADCAIDAPGDEDRFEIEIEAGDFAVVLVEAPNVNLEVEIRDPQGDLLWNDGCQQGQGACLHAASILGATETGTHQVRIYDPEGDGAGSYTLSFEVLPAEVPEIAIIRDFFRDISSLERLIDQDTYVVEATANEPVRVTLEGLSSDIAALYLRQFDFMSPGDPRVEEEICPPPCTLEIEFVPENDGLHYFVVSDAVRMGTGDFQITIEFLPEPVGIAGAGGSLVALVALRRRRSRR